MAKLPALTPDDPLRPPPPAGDTPADRGQQSTGTEKPRSDATSNGGSRQPPRSRRPTRDAAIAPTATKTPASQDEPQSPAKPADWSGTSDVITLRLPAEVAQALEHRRYRLRVPKGMAVAAALEWLLERSDTELINLVEQTQERFETARRRARRAA